MGMMGGAALVLLTGIDGSGKTTQALDCAARSDRIGYRWLRWEPYLTRPAMAAMRWLLRRGSGEGAKRPVQDTEHHDFVGKKQQIFRSAWRRRLWTTIVLLEYLPQCLLRLGFARRGRSAVLCDRYLHDVAIDLSLNYGTGAEGITAILSHPLARLFPRPERIIVFDVEPAIAFQRKQDGTPLAYMEERVELYRFLLDDPSAERIDANRSREEVFENVWSALRRSGYVG